MFEQLHWLSWVTPRCEHSYLSVVYEIIKKLAKARILIFTCNTYYPIPLAMRAVVSAADLILSTRSYGSQ